MPIIHFYQHYVETTVQRCMAAYEPKYFKRKERNQGDTLMGLIVRDRVHGL